MIAFVRSSRTQPATAPASASAPVGAWARRAVGPVAAATVAGMLGIVPLAGTALAGTDTDLSLESVTYSSTGAPQTFTVPAGIDALQVTATGGSGGADWNGTVAGGAGSTISLELAVGNDAQVQAGDALVVMVGGDGGQPNQNGRPGEPGYNGGAWGGGTSAAGSPGSGSGGSSDIRLPGGGLGDRVVVAGGGGGAGGSNGDLGGAGGNGGQPGWASSTGQGGGAAGSPGHGELGQGDTPASHYAAGGGAGGGGYNGGGAGGGSETLPAAGGGGGGGSSYADPSASDVEIEPVGTGTPQITISWIDAPPVITPHDDVTVTVEDGATEAVVGYTKPNAYDAVDGQVAVTCTPAPGSVFQLGSTTVTCTATDRRGNTSASQFQVIVTAPVPDQADLRVDVSGPRKAKVGTQVSYVLTVTNSGPAAATDLTAVLEATGLDGISGQPGARIGAFSLDGTTGSGTTWNLPTLRSGEFATFTMTGTVKAKPGKKIKVLGLATSDTSDPSTKDNRDNVRTKVS